MIKDTECLFKSREKEYQDTIDQIEVSSLSRVLVPLWTSRTQALPLATSEELTEVSVLTGLWFVSRSAGAGHSQERHEPSLARVHGDVFHETRPGRPDGDLQEAHHTERRQVTRG